MAPNRKVCDHSVHTPFSLVRSLLRRHLRPLLLVLALLFSLPLLNGITACGGGGIVAPGAGDVGEGELGSGGGVGVGIATTEMGSEDYNMRQQFGNSLATTTMQSADYKIESTISN